MQDQGLKGVRKEFPCPFCFSTHKSKHAIRYCDKNPEGPANLERKREACRKAYQTSGAAERLRAAARSDIGRIKRSNSTKKMWEEGKLGDTAGEKNGMHGKRHKLESRIKTSRTMSANWYEVRPQKVAASVANAIEKADLVAPILNLSHDFFRQKVDSEGFSTDEFGGDNFFDDEFDPFH